MAEWNRIVLKHNGDEPTELFINGKWIPKEKMEDYVSIIEEDGRITTVITFQGQ